MEGTSAARNALHCRRVQGVADFAHIGRVNNRAIRGEMKYDDASWQFESVAEGLPREAAGTHIAMFQTWALLKGLAGAKYQTDFPDVILKLQQRSITPSTNLWVNCDGVFMADDLNEVGDAFTRAYFDPDTGLYFSDYESTVGGKLPTLFHVPDTWETFDALTPVLDGRFEQWQRDPSSVMSSKSEAAKSAPNDHDGDDDIVEIIALTGFDPQGEPEMRRDASGNLRLVFNFMPPSWAPEADSKDLGPFKDFDAQLQAAIERRVVWEDRELFLIEAPQADTPARVQSFLIGCRATCNSDAGRSSKLVWRAFNIGMRLLGFILILVGAVLHYARSGDVGLFPVAVILMEVFGLCLLVVKPYHPGRKPGADSGSWWTGER